MRPSDYPRVKNILKSIQSWDRVASADSYGAGSYAVLYSKLRKYYNKLPEPKIFTTSVLNKALIETLEHMEKYFGTTRIKLGSFQKLVRGDKELSIFGLPDIISSMGSAPYKEGMRKVVSGESYIELVKFTPKGVEIESIISYGSSDDPKSKHFNDQMEPFASQKTKKMTFDKNEIYKNAKAIYSPK
jgi:acyl-homoserine-lactone acylase